jgi:hypothetical protein
MTAATRPRQIQTSALYGLTNLTTFSPFEEGLPKERCHQPESTLPPILLPSAVVPSVALSGSDLLSACVVAERVVEFEGPAGAWAYGATMIPFSASSSSESERAVTKLPVRSESASW